MESGRIAALLLAAAVLAGCQRSEPERISIQRTFIATIENAEPAAKTSIDADLKVLWKKGDEVSVYSASNYSVKGQIPDEADGQGEAEIQITDGGSSSILLPPKDQEEIAINAAYYPRGASGKIQTVGGYNMAVTIPGTQSYAEGSFGPGAFHMVAVTDDVEDTDFHFRNLMGALRLQLTGSSVIKSIELKGNNWEQLAGAASVNLSGVPQISFTNDINSHPITTIVLDCGEGVQLDPSRPTSFFFALIPCVFANGFEVIITDTGQGHMSLMTEKSQTIKRSTVLTMPSREYVKDNVPSVDLGLSVRWAQMNLGASSEADIGDYYAWGDTSTKDRYELGNYTDPTTNDGSWRSSSDINLLYYTLKRQNDAATARLGGLWRMPTMEEVQELVDSCTKTFDSSRNGWLFTNAYGQIFFPITGEMQGDGLVGEQGYYWTSSLSNDDNEYGKCFAVFIDAGVYVAKRYYGLCIRPVSDY